MRMRTKLFVFVLAALLLVSNFSAAGHTFSESLSESTDHLESSEISMTTDLVDGSSDTVGTDRNQDGPFSEIETLKRRYEQILKRRPKEDNLPIEYEEDRLDAEDRSDERELLTSEAVEEREPIWIDSNEDFADQVEDNDWSGDGSEEEPYIIEGYEIDGSGHGYGIYIEDVTDHFVVKNCYIYNAAGEDQIPFENSGINLQNSTNGHLENNTISRNREGISLVSSTGNTLLENDVYENVRAGINLTESHDNIIENNSVRANEIGIQLWQSDDNKVLENLVKDNEGRGISLDAETLSFAGSVGNEVIGNEVFGAETDLDFDIDYGIYVGLFSNENLIESNDISECFFGIYVGLPLGMIIDEIDLPDPFSNSRFPNSPSDNTVVDNNIQNNQDILDLNPYSIALFLTEDNHLDNNTMKDGGIMMMGLILSHWNSHTITEDNTVNDRPVRYWKDREGGRVPEGSGQVLLSNSEDVIIEEQDLTDASVGIQLGFSDDNIIRKNTLAGGFQGMGVQSSSNNLIYRNDYEENLLGLTLLLSNDNEIYHNNFIQNVFSNAVDLGDNQWNNGYPSGGNYWSDHEGDDEYHGPEQNTSGSDGIVDEPYEQEGFTDEYPLKNPAPEPHVRIEKPMDGSALPERKVTASWSGLYRFTDYLVYEIRLDSGDWIYMGEVNEYGFRNLEEGSNDLQVKVADQDENTFINQASFIVDTTSPDVRITAPDEGSIYGETDVTVEWEGNDPISGIDYYELILDEELEYEGAEPRYELSALEDGSHDIKVRAFDRAGNQDIDNSSFYVDTTPPDIRITSPEDGENFGETSVEVEWEASDAISGIDYFEVRIKGEGWRHVGEAFSYNFTDLQDGEHTIQVRALDNVGNSAIEYVNITVNTALPVVDILEPREGELISDGSITVLWEGDGNGTEIETYEVRIDEGSWIDVEMETSYTFEDVEDGEHIVEVKAINEFGTYAVSSRVFKVDTTPPDIQISNPEEGEVIHTSDVEIRWNGSDEVSEVDHYQVRLEGDDWIDVGDSESHEFVDLEDGEYTVEIRGWDNAGNYRTENVSFLIDLPKEYTITIGPIRDKNEELIDDLTVTLSWDGEERSIQEGERGRYNFTIEFIRSPDDIEFDYKIEHEELEEEHIGSFFGRNSGEITIDLTEEDTTASGLTVVFGVGIIIAIILGMIFFKEREGSSSEKKRKEGLTQLKKREDPSSEEEKSNVIESEKNEE